MDEKELRIGNIISDKGFTGTVNALLMNGSISTTIGVGHISEFQAVPLNSDWMTEFGFTYNDLNGDSGHWQKLPFEILEGEEGFCYDYRTEIKYVHQLQNLYFALTGKELIRNEQQDSEI